MNRPRSSPWTVPVTTSPSRSDLHRSLQAQRRHHLLEHLLDRALDDVLAHHLRLPVFFLRRWRGGGGGALARRSCCSRSGRRVVALGAGLRLVLVLLGVLLRPLAVLVGHHRRRWKRTAPRRAEHRQPRSAADDVLLAHGPQVRRDPVHEQAGREALDEGHEDERQRDHDEALVAVGRDRHQHAREQLRADVEHDQDDQHRAGGLGRQVGMNRKLALPGSTWSQPIVVSVFPASLAATRIFASDRRCRSSGPCAACRTARRRPAAAAPAAGTTRTG